ncbi:MAG: DUF5908 family protein [Verrucomicrobiota bacterium]
MPVEIRELVVRAVINEGGKTKSEPAAAGAQSSNAAEREQIVQECVRRVLRALKKMERR